MELKKQMQGQRTGTEVKGVSLHPTTQDNPITYYRQDVSYPAERTAKSEDDFQTPEEYVEESLSLEDWERQMIIKALEKNHGKRKSAAHDLKISERTLYRKIKEYGLDKEYDE